jgi:hypothetical protein
MGKGLPGGRRQAGNIDYRTEPRSSLPPDRPRRALNSGVGLHLKRGADRREITHPILVALRATHVVASATAPLRRRPDATTTPSGLQGAAAAAPYAARRAAEAAAAAAIITTAAAAAAGGQRRQHGQVRALVPAPGAGK